MKHVALDFNFVREQIEDKTLPIIYIPNDLQQTDILMKALRQRPFLDLRLKLNDEFLGCIEVWARTIVKIDIPYLHTISYNENVIRTSDIIG